MPVVISDELLQRMGMTDREALIEIACRLYDADVIAKPDASRLAGLSRNEFEGELSKRGLPWIRIVDPDYVRQEMEALERWERQEREHHSADRRQ